MEVKELIEKKKQLEREVALLLSKFEEETGTSIDGIRPYRQPIYEKKTENNANPTGLILQFSLYFK
ncbi:unnamed protein product [marine sediment metagenome]|uniref:Uncharacterized protein n=1 Tax=marine sediment metagenome TaxID=412755 RepID=X0W3A0_9ZZZZ